MLAKVSLAVAVGLLSACQTVPENLSFHRTMNNERPVTKKNPKKRTLKQGLEGFLDDAENQATPTGRSILQTGRTMVLNEKAVIRGSCWDYANAVYNRAGFINPQSDRHTVFKSTRHGPYAASALIKPGDFLSHLNHDHHGNVHSAIFVGWHDYHQQQALMLSYAGERRRQPARYKVYDLSSVYHIVRAKQNNHLSWNNEATLQ